ncbi:MAG: zinc transporter ZntB [Rhodospirillales bacterium]|nr:zinc transporter ZntB [Alphaproteobacteria bacterium]MCB1839327.1 zinc transporter ZntB [Alphaproteobacteria bacterium]MCB9977310.1 zinc transporter ZntB [Rhodospirillales bacterium]
MADHQSILHALKFNGDGSAAVLEACDLPGMIKSDELAWVHLDARSREAREWLETQINYLDSLIVDALLAEETRPRMIEYENGMLLILRGMNFNVNAEPEDMVSIRLWIDPSRIISVQRRPVKAVEDIAALLEKGTGPKTSGDFLTLLTYLLFERMEPVLDDLDERTDTLEQEIIDSPEAEERQLIIELRKEAIIYKRYLLPQRDVLLGLRSSPLPWIQPLHKRQLQETLDRVIRYVEDLDSLRERTQIIKDELVNMLSDRMNHNMYLLSVIAAIFLPLHFMTGLLGMNVAGIPGAQSPWAFWIFLVIVGAVVALQIVLFKKMKWF